jgi:hypothetical protein
VRNACGRVRKAPIGSFCDRLALKEDSTGLSLLSPDLSMCPNNYLIVYGGFGSADSNHKPATHPWGWQNVRGSWSNYHLTGCSHCHQSNAQSRGQVGLSTTPPALRIPGTWVWVFSSSHAIPDKRGRAVSPPWLLVKQPSPVIEKELRVVWPG